MKTVLLCLALVITSSSHLVNAECIIPPPPCEALARTAIVAVVDVIEAAEPLERAGDGFKMIPQGVTLRVVERFKGVSAQQRVITGNISYNVEAVLLEAGRRYLLYAHENRDGTWSTTCSRTKLADVANEELEQLRQCARK